MNIIFSKLYKIDVQHSTVESIALPEIQNDLSGYITQLIESIASDSDSKEFNFISDATEVRTLICRTIEQRDYDQPIMQIARRLLEKEVLAQQNTNLPIEIHRGMLIFSMIQVNENIKKFIISKAEHTEFLDDETFSKRQGPPLKKKIYKAFTVDIDSDLSFSRISVYDTNTTISKYWWRDFLELSETRSSEENTKNAFDSIDTKVLTSIKKDHPQDYIYLRNSTIRYFRATPEFRMDDFIQIGIGDYQPYDSNLDVDSIKAKIRQLPEKYKFDTLFEICPQKIRARFINDIKLTDQIDLRLKQDIDNLENVISAQIICGRKYVLVESASGYEYFKNTTRS